MTGKSKENPGAEETGSCLRLASGLRRSGRKGRYTRLGFVATRIGASPNLISNVNLTIVA
jgi:hypothetical protein